MALLSFRGFGAPSLPAQGEQRLPLIFNIQWDNARLSNHFTNNSPRFLRDSGLHNKELFRTSGRTAHWLPKLSFS
jgi:hypothetical protein